MNRVLVFLLVLNVECNGLAADLDDADFSARIDKLRRGDFTVTFLDGDGKPISGSVKYELERHAFPFGTCIHERFFQDDGEEQRRYKEHLKKYFNAAVHERYFKWMYIEQEKGKRDEETGMKQWQWCADHGISMRGHCIFWGSNHWVQPWIKQLGKEDLEAAMKAHLTRMFQLYGDKIKDYDLNNEMIHGDYYARVLGLRNGAQYFKWAKAVAPDADFYVNDYGVLSGKGVDKYVAHIKELLADGAVIGGIGDQANFKGVVPDSQKIWEILDKLSQFKIPVKITEFGISTTDEMIQARELRRFYRLCFAHPGVVGIYMWGFWEGEMFFANSGLWRRDWSIKPAGREYIKLITEEWTTKGEAEADAGGILKFRGFYGDYVFKVGGKTYRAKLIPGSLSASAVQK